MRLDHFIKTGGTIEQLFSMIESNGVRPVMLTTPLTSTSWDGDSFSTVSSWTKIDLSAVFGAPGGIRAVLFYYAIQDSSAASGDYVLYLNPRVFGNGVMLSCFPADDRPYRGTVVIPCDENGDVYYKVLASGSGTFDIKLEILGYWF